MAIVALKVCKICKKLKNLVTEYYPANHSVCKACVSARSVRWWQAHPRQRHEKSRRRWADPAQRAKLQASYRKWYAKTNRGRPWGPKALLKKAT